MHASRAATSPVAPRRITSLLHSVTELVCDAHFASRFNPVHHEARESNPPPGLVANAVAPSDGQEYTSPNERPLPHVIGRIRIQVCPLTPFPYDARVYISFLTEAHDEYLSKSLAKLGISAKPRRTKNLRFALLTLGFPATSP